MVVKKMMNLRKLDNTVHIVMSEHNVGEQLPYCSKSLEDSFGALEGEAMEPKLVFVRDICPKCFENYLKDSPSVIFKKRRKKANAKKSRRNASKK